MLRQDKIVDEIPRHKTHKESYQTRSMGQGISSVPSQQANVELPKRMRALRLVKNFDAWDKSLSSEDIDKCWEVVELDVPVPKDGYVLVKVTAAPINPSDLSNFRGTYVSKAGALPAQMGFEGSGVVVATGGGLMSWLVSGKRVAFAAMKGCTYAEYAVVPALQCLVLPDDVPLEDGAECFVNPLTALNFVEIANADGHRSILLTAAASALCKMVVKLCRRQGITPVCVVRREEQKKELEALGVHHCVVTVDSKEEKKGTEWTTKLKELCDQTDCRLAFDAVAGDLSGKVLHQMPPKSVLYVYGGLSNQPVGSIGVKDLLDEKVVRGYYMATYMKEKNILAKKSVVDSVAALIKTDLSSFMRVGYPLQQMGKAVKDYMSNMGAGKVLILAQALDKVDLPELKKRRLEDLHEAAAGKNSTPAQKQEPQEEQTQGQKQEPEQEQVQEQKEQQEKTGSKGHENEQRKEQAENGQDK